MSGQIKQGSIERRRFVAALIEQCPDALIVTGLGSASYDAHAAGDRPLNFYLWGAMGGTAAFGLGLALAQPQKSVIVLTGDGEQLMGLGALATIGVQRPSNLTVVVLDNHHFGETGMQRSHTGLGLDMCGVARAARFDNVMDIHDAGAVDQLAKAVLARQGCNFALVHIQATEPPRSLPSRDGVYVKTRMRAALGLQPM